MKDLNLFFFKIIDLILSFILIKGLPSLSLTTDMSEKFIPLRKPVPSDFTKASFAANLLAK